MSAGADPPRASCIPTHPIEQTNHQQLGSALQLSTFSYIKDRVKASGYLSEAWVPVAASLLSSVNIVIFMEPLDVARTRLYNQPVDARGRGSYACVNA